MESDLACVISSDPLSRLPAPSFLCFAPFFPLTVVFVGTTNVFPEAIASAFHQSNRSFSLKEMNYTPKVILGCKVIMNLVLL